MLTRRHFLTHALGVTALAPAALAATPAPVPWTFKIKAASLLLSPGYRVQIDVYAGSQHLCRSISSQSPLVLSARTTTLSLPPSPAPVLQCFFSCTAPNGRQWGNSDLLSCAATAAPSITRAIFDLAQLKNVACYRVVRTVNADTRTVEIDHLQEGAVSP